MLKTCEKNENKNKKQFRIAISKVTETCVPKKNAHKVCNECHHSQGQTLTLSFHIVIAKFRRSIDCIAHNTTTLSALSISR